jgi:CBS domain-containing protein
VALEAGSRYCHLPSLQVADETRAAWVRWRGHTLGAGRSGASAPAEGVQGMLTDRDIAIKVVAAGKDPARTTAGDLATQDEVVTIGADDSVEEALRTMTAKKVRRLPVIDGRELVGVVSQADLAKEIDSSKVGELVEAISAAP